MQSSLKTWAENEWMCPKENEALTVLLNAYSDQLVVALGMSAYRCCVWSMGADRFRPLGALMPSPQDGSVSRTGRDKRHSIRMGYLPKHKGTAMGVEWFSSPGETSLFENVGSYSRTESDQNREGLFSSSQVLERLAQYGKGDELHIFMKARPEVVPGLIQKMGRNCWDDESSLMIRWFQSCASHHLHHALHEMANILMLPSVDDTMLQWDEMESKEVVSRETVLGSHAEGRRKLGPPSEAEALDIYRKAMKGAVNNIAACYGPGLDTAYLETLKVLVCRFHIHPDVTVSLLGHTALSRAVIHNHHNVVRFLLSTRRCDLRWTHAIAVGDLKEYREDTTAEDPAPVEAVKADLNELTHSRRQQEQQQGEQGEEEEPTVISGFNSFIVDAAERAEAERIKSPHADILRPPGMMQQMTVLHVAAVHGRHFMIRDFIEAKQKQDGENLAKFVGATNDWGDTALHLAARSGNRLSVEYLIEIGSADPHALNPQSNQTVFDVAATDDVRRYLTNLCQT